LANHAYAIDQRDVSPYDKYPECLDIRTDSSSGRCIIYDGGFPRHMYPPPGPLAVPGNNLGAIGVVPPNPSPGANAAPAAGANATAPAGTTLTPAGSQTATPGAVVGTTPGAAAGPAPGTSANAGCGAATQNGAADAGGAAREAAPRRR
jgi:hypothetical protein